MQTRRFSNSLPSKNLVVRPGIMLNAEQFPRFLDRCAIETVAAPMNDWHWSRTYAENAIWLSKDPNWAQSADAGGFRIFHRVNEERSHD